MFKEVRILRDSYFFAPSDSIARTPSKKKSMEESWNIQLFIVSVLFRNCA